MCIYCKFTQIKDNEDEADNQESNHQRPFQTFLQNNRPLEQSGMNIKHNKNGY